jgi:hypothetical protein
VDAYFEMSDAMVLSQAQLIIDTASAKRLLTMFIEQSQVVKGGLSSYGVSFLHNSLSLSNWPVAMTGKSLWSNAANYRKSSSREI